MKSDQIDVRFRQLAEARKQGREEERDYIVSVLQAMHQHMTHPATRASVRLAQSIIAGLPNERKEND